MKSYKYLSLPRVLAILLVALGVFSCQDKGYTDIINSVGGENVYLRFYGADGDPAVKVVALAGASVNYPLTASIASSTLPNKDYDVSLVVDTNLLDQVNSGLSASQKFQLLPSSLYTLTVANAVIPKGERDVELMVTIKADLIDKSINYLLPLTLTSSQPGVIVPSNYGRAMLGFIGNPLAGSCTRTYWRWNSADFSGTPTVNGATSTQSFIPVDATTIRVQSGYGTQNAVDYRYELSFTNTGGVLSNFKVKITPADVTAFNTSSGIVLTEDAKILIADPVTKHFKFSFQVVNSTPSPRSFYDEFQF